MSKFDDLKFVRVQDFRLIPRQLLENIKGGEINIDRLLQFGDGVAKDPLALLYVLVDEANMVKGFLWAEIRVFEEKVYIVALSIDKEYQDMNGAVLKRTLDFIRSLLKDSQLKKTVNFATTRPNAFLKAGFKKTKLINMEIDLWAAKAEAQTSNG